MPSPFSHYCCFYLLFVFHGGIGHIFLNNLENSIDCQGLLKQQHQSGSEYFGCTLKTCSYCICVDCYGGLDVVTVHNIHSRIIELLHASWFLK